MAPPPGNRSGHGLVWRRRRRRLRRRLGRQQRRLSWRRWPQPSASPSGFFFSFSFPPLQLQVRAPAQSSQFFPPPPLRCHVIEAVNQGVGRSFQTGNCPRQTKALGLCGLGGFEAAARGGWGACAPCTKQAGGGNNREVGGGGALGSPLSVCASALPAVGREGEGGRERTRNETGISLSSSLPLPGLYRLETATAILLLERQRDTHKGTAARTGASARVLALFVCTPLPC